MLYSEDLVLPRQSALFFTLKALSSFSFTELAFNAVKDRRYSDEFKEMIVKECQETGNVALVARRHEILP